MQKRAFGLECPFGDLLWPLVSLAMHHQRVNFTGCEIDAEGGVRWFGVKIPHASTEALIRRIAAILARTLYHEYSRFRGPGKTMVAMLLDDESQDCAVYEAFCHYVLNDNYATLLAEYQVAPRLVLSETQRWLRSLGRFASRLRDDGAAIQAVLKLSALPKLHDIEMYVSDPHGDGRSAIKISLVGGEMLLYKERPPVADQLFDEFIDFFNSLSAKHCLRKVKKLLRDQHQWCEYVHHQPANDPEILKNFYFSMGVLVCAAHVLRISDVHFENLIAEHGLPVLVDVETIGGTCITADTLKNIEGTVLETGIIPMETIDPNGAVFDCSGLSSAVKRQRVATNWRSLGSDHLAPRKAQTSNPGHNLPSELQCHEPVGFCDELCAGFDFAYRLLQQHQSAVLSFLAAFEGKVDSRVLWNSTQSYYDILDGLMTPENLTSEAKWLDHMRQLLAQLRQRAPRGKPRAIEDEEFRQLSSLDIPYFTMASLKGTSWRNGSLSAVVRQLSAHDRTLQLDLIKESLKA